MLPTLIKPSPPTQLVQLHKRSTELRARAPFLPHPMLAEWDEQPRLVVDRGGPWVVLPAERDPLRTLKGEAVLPAVARRDLERVLATGVDFDRLAITHEVDAAALPQDLAKTIGPEGIRCTDEVAAKLLGPVPAPTSTVRSVEQLDRLMGKILNGAAALAATPGGLLDPIVFGVVGPSGPPRTGQVVAWFPLAAWRW